MSENNKSGLPFRFDEKMISDKLDKVLEEYSVPTDQYLVEDRCYQRLKKEYNKYGKLVVAFDFDNTVYDFHDEGWSYDKVIKLLRECHELGFYLIVFTANSGDRYEEMENHMMNNDIPYDSINTDAPFVPFKNNKVYYNILLDDRAGLPSAYNNLYKLVQYAKIKKKER